MYTDVIIRSIIWIPSTRNYINSSIREEVMNTTLQLERLLENLVYSRSGQTNEKHIESQQGKKVIMDSGG